MDTIYHKLAIVLGLFIVLIAVVTPNTVLALPEDNWLCPITPYDLPYQNSSTKIVQYINRNDDSIITIYGSSSGFSISSNYITYSLPVGSIGTKQNKDCSNLIYLTTLSADDARVKQGELIDNMKTFGITNCNNTTNSLASYTCNGIALSTCGSSNYVTPCHNLSTMDYDLIKLEKKTISGETIDLEPIQLEIEKIRQQQMYNAVLASGFVITLGVLYFIKQILNGIRFK